MWVFGYGSLIWKPGFEYLDSKVGYVEGFTRRFWQGNDHHRGTKDKLGRVVTLVEDKQGMTWGRAFLLGPDAVSSLSYLDTRETLLGGYDTTVVTFHPRGSKEEPFPVLLYMALPSNRLYLGPAPLPEMASDIAEAIGECGYNADYLFRLTDFMKEQVPDAWDEHLYNLDHMVRARLKAKNISPEAVRSLECDVSAVGPLKELSDEPEISPSSSPTRGFASTVPIRKLRCMDI